MKAYKTSIMVASFLVLLACGLDMVGGGMAQAAWFGAPAATAAASQPATVVANDNKTVQILATVGKDAQPLTEKIDGGLIDWAGGQVLAIGTCKVNGNDQSDFAMAARGAMLVAARNAALMLAGLKVDKNGRFSQIESGQVDVDAVLKNYRADEPVWDKKNRTVSVAIRLPIYGAGGFVRATVAEAGAVRWDWQGQKPAESAPTLIIIDARNCGVTPCVRTLVVTASGRIVIDARESSTRCEGPAIIFARAGQDGKELVVSSRDVIVIRAQRAEGQNGRIVLSDEQVKKLPAQAKDLMIEGKVVVVSESTGGN